MNLTHQDNFEKIPKLPQRQDSEQEQMRDLIQVANRLGMYDTADYVAWIDAQLKERAVNIGTKKY